MQPEVKNGTKVITNVVRLSYTHVFNKYSPDGRPESGKYMTNLLIPKSDKALIKAIEEAIEAAKKEGMATKWSGKLPKKIDLPLRDGDEKDDDVYAGHWYLNAKAGTKPQVVDRRKELIYDEEEIYSGVWAVVSITFYAYDVSGNRGIACGLNNIMKVRDGERLGGRVSASADFDGVDIDDEDDDEL